VSEDTNGELLTVLSMLARQNVDPWEEAAELGRLPRHTATQRLVSRITALPAQSSPTENIAVADRLIGLLPDRLASAYRAPLASQGASPLNRSLSRVSLMVIAIYVGAMILTQWISATAIKEPPPDAAAARAPAPARDAPAADVSRSR